METAPTISMGKLPDYLLRTAVAAPVFIWGPPGIGKSAVVEQFADELGLPCVSLLGSQLAPEDLIGVPRIEEGYSVFCPPKSIARDEAYVLFLDELNACTVDVQKAFYSLIHDRRLGEYQMNKDSIIIAAGNRASDNAIVRQMSSALVNRMVHVAVKADVDAWLSWAMKEEIHPLVYEYVKMHPKHLHVKPPKEERAFTTPRSWHYLSKALKSWGDDIEQENIEQLAAGVLSPNHAQSFAVWVKNRDDRYLINHLIKGERSWPDKPEERDLLHYLSLAFRDQLLKELPARPNSLSTTQEKLRTQAIKLLRELADISAENAQLVVVADEDGSELPDWFMLEIGSALPRIMPTRKS
jgi:MoxR-like ATPase